MNLPNGECDSTIKATPALSDATELLSPVVEPKNEPEANLNSKSSSDNFRNSQYDSLKSPRFELGELEVFIPDLHLHNEAKSDHAVWNNANDKELADKNVLRKSISVSNDENNDSVPTIGIKKEQSVIDSLKQQNFHLKLQVVLMERDMNSKSADGVAELRLKLAESEANRLATKSENDKLRQTIASIDNEEVTEEKERIKAHIQHLQDQVSMYEHERIEFEQERVGWKQKEDNIKLEYYIRNHVEIYESTVNQAEIYQRNYEELEESYNTLKFDLENAVGRSEAENAINSYKRELTNKNEAIEALERERDQLWHNIRDVNKGLEDIEEERNRLVQLNHELSDRIIELESPTVSQELESETNDYEQLLCDLEMKEKEIKDITDDLLNCEAELESKDAEINALQERVKSLKTQLDSYIEDLEKDQQTKRDVDKSGSALSNTTLAENENHDYNQEIVDKVLNGVCEFFNKDATIDDLVQHLDEMFGSFKEFDQIVEQLHKANTVNSEITNLIDEKDHEIVELKSQLSSNSMQISDLKAKNEQIKLELEAQDNSARLENLESNLKTLEQKLDASEERKAELEEVQSNLNATIQHMEKEYELLKSQHDHTLQEHNTKEETIQMLEEENKLLSGEKEQLMVKKEQLMNDKKQLVEDKKTLKRQMGAVEGELNNYRDKNEELLNHIDGLDDNYDQLMQLADKKDELINDLTKECTRLNKDIKKMQHNFNKEASKSSSLERRIFSLVQASRSVSSSPGSVTVGTAFKQKTFQRMLQLEKDYEENQRELQVLRAELKTSEQDLITQSEKHASQGSDFFGLLTDLLMLVSKSIDDKPWHNKLEQSMDDIRANPTNHVNNCKILCTLIFDGIKIIADNCLFYENQITSLKQQQSPEFIHLPKNQQEYQQNQHQLKNPRQQSQVRTASSELMQRMSSTFAGQIWIYRYTEMKKRFEKEREARKLQYSSYHDYARKLEDDLHKYQLRYKTAIETLNNLQQPQLQRQ
ncbi:hypothetical protein D0Z00_001427 [Geotrichum galactomycetum]|uniref:Uncharacterized protein n=1 Tax=Geotrichum galactomycetum TaxID=27317 RepID=A0ACB6V763_9ASCO|nr:hypothetical protein D0Z00_001427 [Geotrichum candidum]